MQNQDNAELSEELNYINSVVIIIDRKLVNKYIRFKSQASRCKTIQEIPQLYKFCFDYNRKLVNKYDQISLTFHFKN